ncbi:MAG TPA: ATP-dependent Clp protease adaptor ClpS [Armatimonadota bacterium]|nr:ATP-dependent Clp protease adaptor ClpS [Armatimonadota bacterium]
MPEQTVIVPRPELHDDIGQNGGDWIVVVFDNDVNTWEQVINILQKATGCPLEEAEMETWEVHHLGKSIVHHGDKPECDRAAAIISTIGIRVSVDRV